MSPSGSALSWWNSALEVLHWQWLWVDNGCHHNRLRIEEKVEWMVCHSDRNYHHKRLQLAITNHWVMIGRLAKTETSSFFFFDFYITWKLLMRGFQNGIILQIGLSRSGDFWILVLQRNLLFKTRLRVNLHIWNGRKNNIFEEFFAIFWE